MLTSPPLLFCLSLCDVDETVYDAVLLLDRAMSVPLTVAEGLLGVTMTACLAVAAEQSGLPAPHAPALVSAEGLWHEHGRDSIALAECENHRAGGKAALLCGGTHHCWLGAGY